MTSYTRRDNILARIESQSKITHLGFVLADKPSPCHIWLGADSGKQKYGRMTLNGQTVATHIVVYTHYYGYIPTTKQIDHLCNNRLCCNPAHLEMVTHKENQKRRAARAKIRKSEGNNESIN